jgi:hypothetical protein
LIFSQPEGGSLTDVQFFAQLQPDFQSRISSVRHLIIYFDGLQIHHLVVNLSPLSGEFTGMPKTAAARAVYFSR